MREAERLAEANGIWSLEESTGCSNRDCDNHTRPIAFHPEEYRKRGKLKKGDGRFQECKGCGRRFLVSDPVRLHDRNRRYAVDILGRAVEVSEGIVHHRRLREPGFRLKPFCSDCAPACSADLLASKTRNQQVTSKKTLSCRSRVNTEIADHIANLPFIGFAATMLGRYDILAITIVEDGAELVRLVNDEIMSFDGVRHAETTLAAKNLKYDYRWGRIIDR